VAKFQDHLPLYRQEQIFERAGLALPRSTLAQWVGECGVALQPLVDALGAELRTHDVLHADETPVAMLKPGHGQTHRAYLWSYCTTRFNPVQAVVFDFTESRSGSHVREFLRLSGDRAPWKGRLVVDDFSGYKACFELGVTEVGCMAHARRKFHELWVNHGSTVAEQALTFYGGLYDIEREVADLPPDERRTIRQSRAGPVADALLLPLVVGLEDRAEGLVERLAGARAERPATVLGLAPRLEPTDRRRLVGALGERLAGILADAQRRDGIKLELHGSFTRGPKVMTPAIERLAGLIGDCGRQLGLDLEVRPTGGCCDGNNLAAAGLPNIDNLGVVGGEIHSDREFMRVSSIGERAQLTALLLMRLGSGVLAWNH